MKRAIERAVKDKVDKLMTAEYKAVTQKIIDALIKESK